MEKQIEKTWLNPVPVALPITADELKAFGVTKGDIEAGGKRGEMKTIGPWQLPVSYKALATSTVYTPEEKRRYSAEMEHTTVYGMRTMTNCRQSGYCLEGQTNIKGKKYRSFTSSQLFELPDGKLIDVATIHVCIK